MTEPLCISVRDAAKLLGCGKDLVYSLVRANKIPHIHLNGRTSVPVAQLQEWLKTNVHGMEILSLPPGRSTMFTPSFGR